MTTGFRGEFDVTIYQSDLINLMWHSFQTHMATRLVLQASLTIIPFQCKVFINEQHFWDMGRMLMNYNQGNIAQI